VAMVDINFLTLDSIGYINQNFNLCGPSNAAVFKTTSTHGFLPYKL